MRLKLYSINDRLTQATGLVVADEHDEIVAQFGDCLDLNTFLVEHGFSVGPPVPGSGVHVFELVKAEDRDLELSDDIPA